MFFVVCFCVCFTELLGVCLEEQEGKEGGGGGKIEIGQEGKRKERKKKEVASGVEKTTSSHAAVARPPLAAAAAPAAAAARSSRAALAASCAASRATAATPSTLEGCPVESLDQRGTADEEEEGCHEEEEEAPPPPPPPKPPALLSREISKAPTARTFLETTGMGAESGVAEGGKEEGEEGGGGRGTDDDDAEDSAADDSAEMTERNRSTQGSYPQLSQYSIWMTAPLGSVAASAAAAAAAAALARERDDDEDADAVAFRGCAAATAAKRVRKPPTMISSVSVRSGVGACVGGVSPLSKEKRKEKGERERAVESLSNLSHPLRSIKWLKIFSSLFVLHFALNTNNSNKTKICISFLLLSLSPPPPLEQKLLLKSRATPRAPRP